MIQNTIIQVRIDPKTKKSAQKVLDEIGMDLSSAIKAYLRQIIIQDGIPFKLLTENGLTIEQERAILKASSEAKSGKNVAGPFSTAKEIKKFLKSSK